ncbi:MAG: adenine deaminase [Deltaproteobacteria bacterium]|nr:MAG: adenine deaminase [Deltaproteobacteria bacterium]
MTEWQQRLARRLEAARGDRPVDLLFRGGKVVNVFTGEMASTAVAVFDGVVVGFGERLANEVVELDGGILSPGFIDGHFHLESSLLIPAEFARAVLPHGTTTVVADPHEIANVAGIAGVRFMLEASEDIGLEVFFMAPSCVPATHLETAGAELTGNDIEKLAQHPRVLGLAEVMNFPGVIMGNQAILDKLERFWNKIIDGHSPGLSGAQLDAYLCGGIGSDHECTRLEEAWEKLGKGMHIMLREGSQARDLEALAPLVTAQTKQLCMLVSDDCHPEDLLEQGHMNRVLKRAMELSIDPITAIQLASQNPARYFGLRTLGAIAPGYQADIVLLNSLQPLQIGRVYKKGKLVAEDGKCLLAKKPVAEKVQLISMNLEELNEEDLRLQAQGSEMRAIRAVPNTLITEEEIVTVADSQGQAISDANRDLLKMVVIERHQGSGRKGFGFVRGLGLRKGALASTVAHDSHNLIAVGVSDSDMVVAVNTLRELGGGLVVVSDGQVRAQLPLPVAGLMTAASLEQVVAWKKEVNQAALELGATLEHPFMALSFLALPVIPKLKLTDQGLVDVESFTHVPLFV